AAFTDLPDRPVIAACYDKRSCFYSKILGLRISRLGLDFRGRYTAPHEYFVPKADKAHVARWAEERNKSLLAIASTPLEQLLRWIEQASGSLPAAILIVVLLLRALISPFTLKAERDQILQRRLADEIAWLKDSLAEDKTRLSRALMRLYRKNGLTPGLNMIGICIQIPLFLAFFFAVDAVAQTSDAALLWIPSLALQDPAYVLPVLVGAIVFVHLHGSAVRHTPLLTGLRLAAGGLLLALTLPLSAAVNLYLVLSIALMLVQTRAVRAFMSRHDDGSAQHPPETGQNPVVAGDARIIPLSEAGALATAGTKAGRLGLMLKSGLPVPDGMVIASDALSQGDGEAELSREDWRMIDKLWERLDAEVVAVRSSGLNEDGESHSYAGVFESILNIRRDSLPTAIKAVRDSFRKESAAEYGGLGEERGGILIQKMVDPDFAGVMFTEHPGESGCLLIEMVSGLGATIADGTATPDAYRVGRYSGRLLGQDAPPIDVAPLVALGRQLEAIFGSPQDVEWAYRDGRFLILQSRNITSLSRTQDENIKSFVQERERRRLLELCAGAEPDEPVFVQNELSELLPRPTPFSLSFMEALWKPGGSTDLACRALRIRYDVEENGPPFVTSIFGALYVNRRDEKRRLRRGMSLLTNLRLTRMAEQLERNFRDEFLPEFHHEIRVYEAVDESRLKTDELFVLLDHVCRRFVTVNYVQAHIINIAANFYVSLAERQLTKNGLSPAAYLGQIPATVVTEAMSLLSDVRSGKRQIDSFLDLFGHRAPTDYEFADPRYMEDPLLVEQLIATASSLSSTADRKQDLGSISGNPALGLCVERAGRFQGLKEEAKHHCLRELAIIRRILVELDRRFQFDGGIFYVEYDEIMSLADQSFLEEARTRIAGRKAAAEIYAGTRALPAELTPHMLEGLDLSGAATAVPGQLGAVRGDLVAGQAPIRGRARIVNTGDLGTLEDGEILFTRFIHPSWAPAFPRLTGVVTEVGGWLSHAAILAREYNVPTIVGARGVLDAIVTGDDVQLNPDGSIERI
ncbi:MAG: PEP/pyruvate-binding domain-containing protein, partial [Planctomycetota bacterium]